MKCIAGENPQKASVMGNTWLLITDKSVWLSEPTTYSLCQQWRALWSLPLMLHGNRRILSEFVPCLSLVYPVCPKLSSVCSTEKLCMLVGVPHLLSLLQLLSFALFSVHPLLLFLLLLLVLRCCCCCDWSLLPHHQAPFPHLLPTTLQITNWWSCCWRDWDLTKIVIFEDEWDWLIGWFWLKVNQSGHWSLGF